MAVSSSRKPVSFRVICQFKIGPSEKAPPADGTTIVIILSCDGLLRAKGVLERHIGRGTASGSSG